MYTTENLEGYVDAAPACAMAAIESALAGADELTEYDTSGDGRRCPTHPHVIIGSPCGMFDGVCGECEGECYEAELRAKYGEEEDEVYCTTVSVAPTDACCKERRILGGKCENCGVWDDDISF